MRQLDSILGPAVALLLVACSGDAGKADAGTTPDAAVADTGVADTGAPDGSQGTDAWKAVTDRLTAEVAGGKIKGGFVTLDVYRGSDGKLVYSRAFGATAPARTRAIPVASASKWVTSTVILALVADGKLSLDDTTGKWLKWTGVKGSITLRQLLSFTSGLRDPLCIYRWPAPARCRRTAATWMSLPERRIETTCKHDPHGLPKFHIIVYRDTALFHSGKWTDVKSGWTAPSTGGGRAESCSSPGRRCRSRRCWDPPPAPRGRRSAPW